VGKKGSRIPGFKDSSEILKRKQNLQRKTLEPLTPDVFIHSFEDDPYFWGLFNNAIAKKAILGYKLTIDL